MDGPLDHPIISERYFFPRRDPCPDPIWVEADGARLACWYRAPHPDAPTLVFFHGNGEVVADYLPELAQALLPGGLNLFLAEYRGYGASSGRPSLVSMLDDVVAIRRAIAAPTTSLVVYGRSVGSIYALEMAARYPSVRGLVIESGIAAPLERVLMRVTPAELGVEAAALAAHAAQTLDHRAKIAAYPGPVLVFHTAGDRLVSADNAHRLAGWAAGRSTLRVFDQGDHNSIWAYHGAEISNELIAWCRSPSSDPAR